ncbi:MAG: hypothetical protein ACPGVT_12590 [Maricaulaceae bacterium]
MPNADSPKHFEKKTERLDVRLSTEKKQAFIHACENQSDTPSQAVRRFINSYIRRSHRDDIDASLRMPPKSKILFILGGLAMLMAVVLFKPLFSISTNEHMTHAELFDYYDYDQSGVLELTEISANDHHLHRVLNIDGTAGISRDEFITDATMLWKFTVPENWTVIKDVKYGLTHKRVSRMTFPKLPEGSLIPTGNQEKPFLTVAEFKALDDPISVIQKKLNIDPRKVQRLKASSSRLSSTDQSSGSDAKRNYVIFDLRNPSALMIDVLEQKSQSNVSKSLIFSRSVEWVKGDMAPHFVMGRGSKDWKAASKNID